MRIALKALELVAFGPPDAVLGRDAAAHLGDQIVDKPGDRLAVGKRKGAPRQGSAPTFWSSSELIFEVNLPGGQSAQEVAQGPAIDIGLPRFFERPHDLRGHFIEIFR